MDDHVTRSELVRVARLLHEAGYSPGTSGNISARIGDSIIVSPTGARLGTLVAESLSVIDLSGGHVGGPAPTKESIFHAAVYRARPRDRAIIHLHSPYASALSCLSDLNETDALPAYTPYYVMRVGRLPVVPYFPPGDVGLAAAIEATSAQSRSVLLANHGLLVAGTTLDAAAAAAEEIEQTARLHFTIDDRPSRPLSSDEVADLHQRFP